jgi:hypothetical protein
MRAGLDVLIDDHPLLLGHVIFVEGYLEAKPMPVGVIEKAAKASGISGPPYSSDLCALPRWIANGSKPFRAVPHTAGPSKPLI